MQLEIAISYALKAVSFIVSDDTLRDRFLALSGMSADDIRASIEQPDFLASILEFLVNHDPDLILFSENSGESPETIIQAWRTLGGGVGQEW